MEEPPNPEKEPPHPEKEPPHPEKEPPNPEKEPPHPEKEPPHLEEQPPHPEKEPNHPEEQPPLFEEEFPPPPPEVLGDVSLANIGDDDDDEGEIFDFDDSDDVPVAPPPTTEDREAPPPDPPPPQEETGSGPAPQGRVNPYSVVDITPSDPAPCPLGPQRGGVASGYSVPVPCGYATPSGVPLIIPTYSTPVICPADSVPGTPGPAQSVPAQSVPSQSVPSQSVPAYSTPVIGPAQSVPVQSVPTTSVIPGSTNSIPVIIRHVSLEDGNGTTGRTSNTLTEGEEFRPIREEDVLTQWASDPANTAWMENPDPYRDPDPDQVIYDDVPSEFSDSFSDPQDLIYEDVDLEEGGSQDQDPRDQNHQDHQEPGWSSSEFESYDETSDGDGCSETRPGPGKPTQTRNQVSVVDLGRWKDLVSGRGSVELQQLRLRQEQKMQKLVKAARDGTRDGLQRTKAAVKKTRSYIKTKSFSQERGRLGSEDSDLFIEVDCFSEEPVLGPEPGTLTQQQCVRRSILALILDSEKKYLEALRRILERYEKPLSVLEPRLLSDRKLKVAFYRVREILQIHFLFQIALASRAAEWDQVETIGDVFVASFSKSMVLEAYSEYVNNLSSAMSVLRKTCLNKPAFLDFLRERQASSRDQSTLYSLLMKPVHRFPHFIQLLQDLLSHTPPLHPDRLPLQMALTELETLAQKLNQKKKEADQRCEIRQLSKALNDRHLSKLLSNGSRFLLRCDDVIETVYNERGEVVKTKERRLFLLNDLLLCATPTTPTAMAPPTTTPPIALATPITTTATTTPTMITTTMTTPTDTPTVVTTPTGMAPPTTLAHGSGCGPDPNPGPGLAPSPDSCSNSGLDANPGPGPGPGPGPSPCSDHDPVPGPGNDPGSRSALDANPSPGPGPGSGSGSGPVRWTLGVPTDQRLVLKWSVPLILVRLLELSCRDEAESRRPAGEKISTNSRTNKVYLGPGQLYQDLQNLVHDLDLVQQIYCLITGLKGNYQNVNRQVASDWLSGLQRLIQLKEEEIHRADRCRIHLELPGKTDRAGKPSSFRAVFNTQTPAAKQSWINTLQTARLALEEDNLPAWLLAEDEGSHHHHPLLLGHMTVLMSKLPEFTAECCVHVPELTFDPDSSTDSPAYGHGFIWVASCTNQMAQISVVALSGSNPCSSAPKLLECFNVESRVLCMAFIPPLASQQDSPHASQHASPNASQHASTNVSHAPSVCLGMEEGSLVFYRSSQRSKKVLLQRFFTPEKSSVTSLLHFKQRLYVGMVTGAMATYRRTIEGSWDGDAPVCVCFGVLPVRALLAVGDDVWAASGGNVYIFSSTTHKIERHLEVVPEGGVMVSQLVSAGGGVWISFSSGSTLRLFHTETLQHLQDIDISTPVMLSIPGVQRVSVSSLLVVPDWLLVGTNLGVTVALSVPRLQRIPKVTGRGMVSLHAHSGAVRFLTMATALCSHASSPTISPTPYAPLSPEGEGVWLGGAGCTLMALQDSQCSQSQTFQSQSSQYQSLCSQPLCSQSQCPPQPPILDSAPEDPALYHMLHQRGRGSSIGGQSVLVVSGGAGHRRLNRRSKPSNQEETTPTIQVWKIPLDM